MSLTRSQYQQIMREYDQLQYESRHQLEQRKKEIAGKIPRIPEISEEITAAGADAAKARLFHRKEEEEALLGKIGRLADERHRLLTEAGYPADYLTLKHHCCDCQDTGYVGNRPCHCLTQRTIDILYRQSNLGEILETENFEHFCLSFYSDEEGARDPLTRETPFCAAKKALDYCRKFSRSFAETGENLLIYGPAGVGKTFLTHCVAREALEAAKSVLYLSSGQLFDLLSEKSFSYRKSEEQMAVHESIFQCDLLIIDDLGAEFTNAFTTSALFHCLNERILTHKSTIISTNLSPTELRNVYTERISSRLTSCFTLFKLSGGDIRRQKVQQRFAKKPLTQGDLHAKF